MLRASSTASPTPATATFDLWQLRFDGDLLEKLTFNPAQRRVSSLVATTAAESRSYPCVSARRRLYELPANGAGNETLLVRSKLAAVPSGWSRDGRVLFYTLDRADDLDW